MRRARSQSSPEGISPAPVLAPVPVSFSAMTALTTRNPLLLAAATGGLLVICLLPSEEPGEGHGPADVATAQATRPRVPATSGRRSENTPRAGVPARPGSPGLSGRRPAGEPDNETTPHPAGGSAAEIASRPGRRDPSGQPASERPHDRRPTFPPRRSAAASSGADPTVKDASTEERLAALPPLTVPYSMANPAVAATIPAALSDAVIGLDEAGEAEIARLTDTFLQRIAGGSEDPRDPEHQRRWAGAQEESDTRMRASLGGQAWLDRHREVHRGVTPTPASPPPQKP